MTNRRTHLVLGGTGFIGRHVCDRLRRDGATVLALGREVPAHLLAGGGEGRTTAPFRSLSAADWDGLLAGVDVVHYYAWSSIPATANAGPARDLVDNLPPMIDMLEALRRRGGGRVVFSSSGGTVYGKIHATPISEGHGLHPVNAYGVGKLTAENYLRFYASASGLDCRIARIANPYGIGQKPERGQGAVVTFLHKAMGNEPIVVWGDGSIVRDYVYIDDVVDALVRLSDWDDVGGHDTFNIGSGTGLSLRGIVSQIGSCLGRPVDVIWRPARPFDVPVNVLDVSRAQHVLRWKPTTSFADGLSRTVEALRLAATIPRTSAGR